MILQLLKKDCIIAKNYVAAVILIGVGLPVLLVWKQPQMLEVFALPGAVFISSVAFNLAVSEKENMYPKATALLCATPYNREKLVEEKYLLYFLIYLYCCVVFRIEMQVIPQLSAVDFVRSVVVVFWIQVICMGIFLPIQYRFGYEKTKSFQVLICFEGLAWVKLNGLCVPCAAVKHDCVFDMTRCLNGFRCIVRNVNRKR